MEALCIGGWDPHADPAAAHWLVPGQPYVVLEVTLTVAGESLIRIAAGDSNTPGLWTARYFQFDSAQEDWVAHAEDGWLAFSPRELAEIDWFTYFDEPEVPWQAAVSKYLARRAT